MLLELIGKRSREWDISVIREGPIEAGGSEIDALSKLAGMEGLK